MCPACMPHSESTYNLTIKYMYINPLTHLTFVQNEVTCIYTHLCKSVLELYLVLKVSWQIVF